MSDESDPDRPRSRGPRGAGADTRGDILAAAAEAFAEHGYAPTSMRAVARAADVDPALVRHYFPDKAELFIEAMRPARADDPRLLTLIDAPRELIGALLVQTFLELWDDATLGPRLRGILLTGLTTPEIAEAMQDVLLREMLLRLVRPDRAEERAAAAASQLMGLASARYLVRIPALAEASSSDIARIVGPTLQRYLDGDLDPKD